MEKLPYSGEYPLPARPNRSYRTEIDNFSYFSRRNSTASPYLRRSARRRRSIFVYVATFLVACLSAALAPAAQADSFRNNFWIYGSIDNEFRSLGFLWQGGPPRIGEPNSPELVAGNDGRGRWQAFGFDTNRIVWSPDVDVNRGRLIGGLILQRWLTAGDERGVLGYPLDREVDAPGGQGKLQEFQGGSIYWRSGTTQAQPIWGAIKTFWKGLGGPESNYGYPVSGEYNFNGGKRQNFQGGPITWYPNTGIDMTPTPYNSLRVQTFIAQESLTAKCDPDPSIVDMRYRGDNRSFNATAPSFRTQVDVMVSVDPNQGGKKIFTPSVAVGVTQAVPFILIPPRPGEGSGTVVAGPTRSAVASADNVHVTSLAPYSSDSKSVARVRIDHLVSDPMCIQYVPLTGGIKYDFNIGFTGSQWRIQGTRTPFPAYEIYVRDLVSQTNTGWRTAANLEDNGDPFCLVEAICDPVPINLTSSGWNGGNI